MVQKKMESSKLKDGHPLSMTNVTNIQQLFLLQTKLILAKVKNPYFMTEKKYFSAIPDENGIMLADKYDGHYLKNSSKTGDGIFRIMKLLSRSLAQNSKSNDDIDNERTVQLEVSKRQSCC